MRFVAQPLRARIQGRGGHAPSAMVVNPAIERAKDSLLNSTQPIDQIAHQCGFTDQSHFTRAFEKAVGVTWLVAARKASVGHFPAIIDLLVNRH
jgi:AraC-like DNA-binding protein